MILYSLYNGLEVRSNQNIMSYNFEKFTAVGGKFVVGISISKPGGLSMTSGFYNKYGIGKYSSADIYFDQLANAVAIKFITGTEGSFKLKHRDGGKGGYLSAISFIKMNGLEKYFGKRYEPRQYHDENAGDVFVMDIQ